MNKRKGPEIQAIIMAFFALAIVAVLLQMMRENLPPSADDLPDLPHGARSGVVDSVFYHYDLKFSIKRPGVRWQMREIRKSSILVTADSTQKLWPQIHWLLEMERAENGELLAKSRVGVLEWPVNIQIEDMTINLLVELIQTREKNGKRIQILQPVTTPAHRIMQGYYFVLIVPEPAPLNVWIISLLPRRNRAFIFFGQTSERWYEETRRDLERNVSYFRPLPFDLEK